MNKATYYDLIYYNIIDEYSNTSINDAPEQCKVELFFEGIGEIPFNIRTIIMTSK